MKYKDFYTYLLESSFDESNVKFIKTESDDKMRVGFLAKNDRSDRIRESLLRTAYKNKIHGWVSIISNLLFSRIGFNPIPFELIFSVVKSDDNEHGRVQAYVYKGTSRMNVRYEFLSGSYQSDDIIRVIVHEWAHIWHGKQKKSVDTFIKKVYEIYKKKNDIRISLYGLTNHNEFWAHLIENYNKLDDELKQFVSKVIELSKK